MRCATYLCAQCPDHLESRFDHLAHRLDNVGLGVAVGRFEGVEEEWIGAQRVHGVLQDLSCSESVRGESVGGESVGGESVRGESVRADEGCATVLIILNDSSSSDESVSSSCAVGAMCSCSCCCTSMGSTSSSVNATA